MITVSLALSSEYVQAASLDTGFLQANANAMMDIIRASLRQ
jgi:hypothetical protein